MPAEKAREGCRAKADIDLSAFDGFPLEAEIDAWGEGVGTARDPWNGLKFQFQYTDADSGENRYPNTPSLRGDFARRRLFVRDPNCARRTAAQLVLGLQDTSGKVAFDLSTLRIRAGRVFWPVTNQTHRCEYTGAVASADAPSCGKALQALPVPPGGGAAFRGFMSPTRRWNTQALGRTGTGTSCGAS